MKTEVSELLMRWSAGDESALEFLTPLVYQELRRLGRSALRRGGPHSIVQPTVLVHEAWLRLTGNQRFEIGSRAQFYGLASKIMRDILVDALRRRRSAKRGGSWISVSLDENNAAAQPRSIDFLILDDALTRLGQVGERYQKIVELRFFAGLTIEETAKVVGVSHATMLRAQDGRPSAGPLRFERGWNFARAWLRRELQPGAQAAVRS